MSAEQVTTVIASIIQGTSILFVLIRYIKGLRNQISALEKTVDIQKGTLSAMEERLGESEKVASLYKSLLHDLPQDVQTYKAFSSMIKDETISELKDIAKDREEKVKKLREIEQELQMLKHEDTDRIGFVRTAIFLYQEENRSLLEFLNSLGHDVEAAIKAASTSRNASEALGKLGITLEVVNTSNPVDIIERFIGDERQSRLAATLYGEPGAEISFSIGDQVMMNEAKIEAIDEMWARLRRFVDQ